MSILSTIFNGQNQNNISNNSNSLPNSISKSNNSLNLENGSSITAKVIDSSNGSILLDVDGRSISAKLDGNYELAKGEIVCFDVKGNTNAGITLSPLYTNTANVSTAIKALSSANLPITEFTVNMTDSMINQNMKIDSVSLTNTFRQLSSYSANDVSTIIEMKKFGLEINNSNIENFQAFKNFENQLTDGINEVIDSLPEAFNELKLNGNDDNFRNFTLDLINNFRDVVDLNVADLNATDSNAVDLNITDSNISNSNISNSSISNDNMISNNRTSQNIFNNNLKSNEVLNTVNKSVDNLNLESLKSELSNNLQLNSELLNAKELNDGTKDTNVLKDYLEQVIFDGMETKAETVGLNNLKNLSEANVSLAENYDVSLEANLYEKDINSDNNYGFKSLSVSDKANMVNALKESGLDINTAKYLLSNDATNKDFLDATKLVIEKGHITDKLKDMISSAKFANVLKTAVEKNWLISPKDVGQKENLENLYNRINEQIRHIQVSLSQNSLEHTQFSANLTDMNNNLDFMNQMNNLYQYIQLPLKMNGSEATGDLFVYTDKKSLSRKEGNVSALLHLDMNNLGPLDVFASITSSNQVFTKFYLADDDTLSFIESNINILNKRLENRGYSMKTEMVTKANQDNERALTIDEAMGNIDSNNSNKMIMKYSFDMRA